MSTQKVLKKKNDTKMLSFTIPQSPKYATIDSTEELARRHLARFLNWKEFVFKKYSTIIAYYYYWCKKIV